MSGDSKFTEAERELIRSLTGLSVDNALLLHVGKVLAAQFAPALKQRGEASEMLARLLDLLGDKDKIRLCTLLALARHVEEEDLWGNCLELQARTTSEIVDLRYDWLSKKLSPRPALQDALGYESRRAFIALCRKVGVDGSRRTGRDTKTYSSDQVLKLLRGKLATLPWWEARFLASMIAAQKRSKVSRRELAAYLAPPRPNNAFKPRVRIRRPRR